MLVCNTLPVLSPCVAGLFQEPGSKAIEAVGIAVKAATLFDPKASSKIFCSGSLIWCQFGLKNAFEALKHKDVPDLKVEGVRKPAGCKQRDCIFTAVPLQPTASPDVSKCGVGMEWQPVHDSSSSLLATY